MLAAPNRLTSGRDIARTMSKGTYVSAGPLSAKYVQTKAQYSRAVIVVSKKISKKAVVRNRIRRRLAAEIAASWETVATGYDIVITVRDDVSAAPAADLRRNCHALLVALPRAT